MFKNLPANAEDVDSTPGPGRFHMQRVSWACASQQEKPPQWEARAPKLEKAHMHQQRGAKNKEINKILEEDKNMTLSNKLYVSIRILWMQAIELTLPLYIGAVILDFIPWCLPDHIALNSNLWAWKCVCTHWMRELRGSNIYWMLHIRYFARFIIIIIFFFGNKQKLRFFWKRFSKQDANIFLRTANTLLKEGAIQPSSWEIWASFKTEARI